MAKIIDWDSHIGRRLSLRDLHVFFIVAQEGSLAKAAAQLQVSQPAVSQLIADLEHSVGARLFDRSSRGVTLTIYGRALLGRGRSAFDELKQGVREIEYLSNPHTGEVKFGCPEGLSQILPPVIESFSRLYPGILLDIHEEEFASFAGKLRSRSLDFVLQRLHGRPRPEDHSADDLDVEILFEDELVIVAGADSRFSRKKKIDLAQLIDEPWILASPPSWNHKVITEACQARCIPMPKVVLSTFSSHIRASMLGSGRYIATFPRSVANYFAGPFGVRVLNVELPPRPWPVAILTLKNRMLSPVAGVFLDHLRQFTASNYPAVARPD
ncbi:LysR family transcriptional regulator [Bradyrhizobium diazoefficiens]|uniref:LysR family transcriptional regulator n=1 Tax=Bradyrhizobium diazoefficiens TaxID=1355477 RepID=UPI00190CD41C|nr:LysR family transcriptional regulator [Bradyrhizobium diazoefficiens]QQO12547.1 LysR family transcriptional regulator [Bradyrhizobium diazoefficiens]